jgi:hypothetical protein
MRRAARVLQQVRRLRGRRHLRGSHDHDDDQLVHDHHRKADDYDDRIDHHDNGVDHYNDGVDNHDNPDIHDDDHDVIVAGAPVGSPPSGCPIVSCTTCGGPASST